MTTTTTPASLADATPAADMANAFMLGAIVMGCLVAGLCFLRFYRRTRDRLFAAFAVAFWVLGANWLALAFTRQDEVRTALYAVRLVAFVIILAAILDKNRRR